MHNIIEVSKIKWSPVALMGTALERWKDWELDANLGVGAAKHIGAGWGEWTLSLQYVVVTCLTHGDSMRIFTY